MDQEREVPEEAGGGAEEEGEGEPHEGEHDDDPADDDTCFFTFHPHLYHPHHHVQVCVLKFDHFENIHRLDPKLPSYEGAPNFRQVILMIISQFGCNF